MQNRKKCVSLYLSDGINNMDHKLIILFQNYEKFARDKGIPYSFYIDSQAFVPKCAPSWWKRRLNGDWHIRK